MDIAIWIQFATMVIMAIGIIATACVSAREIKNANEQALAQSRQAFFAEYTRRYHDIILAMPDEVFLGIATASGSTLKYMQLYFNLCSEEFYLHEAKQIPDDIWAKWVDGMRITTRLMIFRNSWKLLGGHYDGSFTHFMHHKVFTQDISDNVAK